MHISIANFSQMVTARVCITIVNKYKVLSAFPLTSLHLTLVHSKGDGQDRVQSDSQYLANGGKLGKHCQQIESRMRAFDYLI